MAPSRTHRDPGACVHTPHGALLTPQDHDLILEYADELRGAWPVLAPPRARPRERPEELAPSLRGTRALLPHRCSPTLIPPKVGFAAAGTTASGTKQPLSLLRFLMCILKYNKKHRQIIF